jgi:hypothetical protein
MDIISVAGAANVQSGYEYPDYQQKIEQLQKQVDNLQTRAGKTGDDQPDAAAKMQKEEMIQSQISQIQMQIQRLETMASDRETKKVSSEVIDASFAAASTAPDANTGNPDAANGTADLTLTDKKLDILV